MATLSVQRADYDGLTPTFSAADVAGDQYQWSSTTFLYVKNDDASPHTITVTSQYSARPGLTPTDTEIVIAAGEERVIAGLTRDGFRDSNGFVQITYDDVTSVTVAAINVQGA